MPHQPSGIIQDHQNTQYESMDESVQADMHPDGVLINKSTYAHIALIQAQAGLCVTGQYDNEKQRSRLFTVTHPKKRILKVATQDSPSRDNTESSKKRMTAPLYEQMFQVTATDAFAN